MQAMKAHDFEVLARIPELRFLSVDVMDGFSWTVPGGDGLFQNLRRCRTNIKLTFLQGAMPILMEVELCVAASKGCATSYDIGLGNLLLLMTVEVWIACEGATAGQVEEAEMVLRHSVDVHPNHPTINVNKFHPHVRLDFFS